MWWKTMNGTMDAEVESVMRAATTNGVDGEGPDAGAAPVSREAN
jgi:hypothetical protein